MIATKAIEDANGLRKIWKSLNTNGIYIEDDINDNIAFQEFSVALGVDPIIVKCDNKFLGLIVKS